MAYKFQLGAFTASGSIKAEEGFDANDMDIQNVGEIKLDSIVADNQDIDIEVTNSRQAGLEIKQGGNAYITIDTADSEVQVGQHLVMAANKNLKFSATDFIQLDTNVKIAAAADIEFDADGGDFIYKDGNTEVFRISNSSGDVTLKPIVDAKDLIFAQRDGTEVMRVEDDASLKIAGGAGSSGVTVSAAGQLTADGRVIVDDATEATTTTDGSLQTDGGLSVAKSAVIGDDLDLLSDAAVLSFGADQDVSFTHIPDGGLQLNGDMGIAFSDTNSSIGHSSGVGGLLLMDHNNLKLTATAKLIVDTPIVEIDDDGVVLKFGADQDVVLTHVHNEGLRLSGSNGFQFRDGNAQIVSGQANHLDLTASAEIHLQSANLNIDAPSGVNISAALVVEGDLTVNGTTTTVDTTNLLVKDKLFTVNDGGAAASGAGAGFEIEEDGSATGFIKTDPSDRTQWTLQAPGASILTIDMNAAGELEYTAAKKLSVAGNFTIDADITTAAAEINLLDHDTAIGSSITIADADGILIHNADGGMEKVPASDLKTYLADNSFNVALKADGQTLANGVNYFASASANVSVNLPASPSVGDSVMIKAMENCGSTRLLTINRQGSHTIDGANEIILESPHAAVECVYVSGSTGNLWKVF